MLLRRPGYQVDVDAVLKACAQHGVAVEINCNPHRLDLDWRWHRRALELGCMMSINPDAHSTAELDLTQWGVRMARKGGVSKERVLNSQSLAEIARTFETRRASPARNPGVSSGSARQPSRGKRNRSEPAPDRA
jgi:DNA polymerase (family X)